ncbi:hypothetical protein niasHT_037660 [Heterodera trifolii]|uniref:Uncharacterized protein n=1 Tax=Heterodera trifolii TaxID=157864 RepID=A0ABD2IP37_9BILA
MANANGLRVATTESAKGGRKGDGTLSAFINLWPVCAECGTQMSPMVIVWDIWPTAGPTCSSISKERRKENGGTMAVQSGRQKGQIMPRGEGTEKEEGTIWKRKHCPKKREDTEPKYDSSECVAARRRPGCPNDQRVDIRCVIAMESTHAFIPGPLTLHNKTDNGWERRGRWTVFTRDERSNSSSVFSSSDHSVIFPLFGFGPGPAKARRRGRVPRANLYQRTLENDAVQLGARQFPSQRRCRGPHGHFSAALFSTAEGCAFSRRLDAARQNTFCQCAKGFEWSQLRKGDDPPGHCVQIQQPFVLCVSFLLVALFFCLSPSQFGLGQLFREKKAGKTKFPHKRPRSNIIYGRAADYLREQSPISDNLFDNVKRTKDKAKNCEFIRRAAADTIILEKLREEYPKAKGGKLEVENGEKGKKRRTANNWPKAKSHGN